MGALNSLRLGLGFRDYGFRVHGLRGCYFDESSVQEFLRPEAVIVNAEKGVIR